ncbi:helix-turn-helix domain-containing protein [Parvibaculum sp.]|uniref:helix-turn-helix domain-containing protein n=1 Tax=Parvibaculum sp. TaxID=2024848 RepID=UPI003BA97EDD
MSVPARLAQIRKFLGLSQKEMGKRVRVSGTTWQNYELENAAPNAHVLAHLSGEGFDMNWVLTGQGEMRKAGAAGKQETGFAELAPLELPRNQVGRHRRAHARPALPAPYARHGSGQAHDR